MAKLDVELGKAVGISRTKAGSGDKEEAFLIRSTLLKFAGAFCVVFLVVGGLAIFLSQWEVSFQQGINLDERIEHEAVEQEAFTQFMQVGNLLTTFLRGESHKKAQVNVVQVEITKTVNELLSNIAGATSSDDIQTIVDEFSDKIYKVLDEYSELVDDDSTRAKDLLRSLNNLMAADDVMPASREKIRPVKGADNRVKKVPRHSAKRDDLSAGDAHAEKKPQIDAKQRLSNLGGDLQAIIKRVFQRVDALSDTTFPDAVRNKLVALKDEVTQALSSKADLQPLRQEFQSILAMDGVRGVDRKVAEAPELEMANAVKEMVQLFPVIDHVEELETLKLQWETEESNEGQVMHSLHKMVRDQVLPFEWVTNGMLFGHPKPGNKGASVFSSRKKYSWWNALREEE